MEILYIASIFYNLIVRSHPFPAFELQSEPNSFLPSWLLPLIQPCTKWLGIGSIIFSFRGSCQDTFEAQRWSLAEDHIWGFGGAWVLKQLCCVRIRRRESEGPNCVKHDNESTFNKFVIIILFSASKLPSVPLKCAPEKQQINSASTFAVNRAGSSWYRTC